MGCVDACQAPRWYGCITCVAMCSRGTSTPGYTVPRVSLVQSQTTFLAMLQCPLSRAERELGGLLAQPQEVADGALGTPPWAAIRCVVCGAQGEIIEGCAQFI